MFSNYRPAAIELPHARELRTQVNEHAAKDFAEKSSLSSIHDESSSLPEFSMNEIIKGKFLGKGLFGNVYEVQAVNINGKKKLEKVNNQNESPLEKPQEESDDEEVGANATTEQKKAFIASHCIRENKNGRADARFAVKILRSEIKEDVEELYYQAILDMATETKFLSGIRHPNVIKLRGKAAGTPFDDKYFLVLDRLYGVLNDRIETWGRLHRRYTSLAGRQILDRKSEKLSNLWEERVLAAFELSSAMTYLHNRRIIHRDLRPENLGFDMVSIQQNNCRSGPFCFVLAVLHANTVPWYSNGSTGVSNYLILDWPVNFHLKTRSMNTVAGK